MTGLYATETWLQVVMVTGVIGGGAAILAGRAVATTWRPYWYVIAYMLLLGAGVHFLHFALFAGDILSLPLLSRRRALRGGGRLDFVPHDAGPPDGAAISLALRANQPLQLARARPTALKIRLASPRLPCDPCRK